MINKYYTIISFALFSFVSYAQDKSNPITININTNMPNTQCVLANHLGANKYRVETITLDKFGAGSFVDKKGIIIGGIYMIIFPTKENKYFELILSGDEKNIELFVDENNFNELTFNNSKENEIFYSDVKYLAQFQKALSEMSAEYKSCKDNALKITLGTAIKAKEKEQVDRRIKTIQDNPNLFYTKILKLMRDIDVPEVPLDAKGKVLDSNFRYYYFKSHYWDYTDFNDDRLLFTPIFEKKFKYFFNELVIKNTDTIKKEIDYVISKIKNSNSKINRYCLATLLNDFANSKIMGHEELYVYLVKNYYANGKAPWVAPADLKRMREDADKISANKIVEKKTIPIDQYLGF